MTAPINQKCRFCGADTVGSDVCYECLDNPERQKFLELAKNTKAPKTYPTYAAFCDDPEKETGFKPARVAQWLALNEHFKTDKSSGILYYGNEETGIWSEEGEVRLEQILTAMLGENNRKSHYVNILHVLRGLTYCGIEFSRKIAVENGLLDLEKLELTSFTLEEMAQQQIPTAYNKEADCPQFKEFLKQVVSPEDALTLQEWSGYLLYPAFPIHKVLWIHGEGRNGKGVYDRTMKGILGTKNCSSVGLEELDGTHRFALHQLHGKLYNPCSEPAINPKKLFRTEIFQKISGGDLIDAERKGIQKRTEFTNYAKITVIGNKFPKIHNPTTAFRDRMMFIKFPNYFSEKERIPNLENAWLSDSTERSGILNWMLEGLKRLLTNEHFTESKSQEETELEFQRVSDSISAFLKENAVYGSNYEITRLDAWEAYCDYCDIIGTEPEQKSRFTEKLKHTPKIHDGTTRAKGKKERAWKGVTFKTQEDRENGTDGTDVSPLEKFANSKNSKERENGVPNVPLLKNCGHCANFRMPNCQSEAWESRSGNAEPLTNYCFKPIQELGE